MNKHVCSCGAVDCFKEEEVTISGGATRIKVSCSECGAYIKWKAKADNQYERELLADPRWRDWSRAQLIGRIMELEG